MARLLLLMVFSSVPAWAHGGKLAAEALYFEDGDLAAVSSNFGLLTKTEDGFGWACFDTLTSLPFEGFWHRGAWYAETRAGLYTSDDKGCSWSPVEGSLRGQPVHGLRVLGDALVARAQRLPAPGQLHRDEGQGFALWGEPLPQGEFLDFVVRSSDEVVLALIQDDGADPALWISDPSLETWTLAAVLEGLNQPRFIDLELGERRKVIAAFRGAAGELWIVDADDTLSRRAQLPTPVQEGRTHGDEHWVITLTGVPLKAIGDGPFLPAEGPEHCMASKGSDLVACGDLDDGHLTLERIEGGFRPRHPFSSLTGSLCPEAECVDRWDQLEALWTPAPDAGPAGDAGAPIEPPSGCGCAALPPDLMLAFAAWLGLRRRRTCSRA